MSARQSYEEARRTVRRLGYVPGAKKWLAFWEGFRFAALGLEPPDWDVGEGGRLPQQRKAWLEGWKANGGEE